jgi:hypothetical protein
VSVGNNNRYSGSPESNKFFRNEVTMTYRRGLEAFTITSRDAGKNVKWEDPIEINRESASAPEVTDVPITSGTFAGTTAHIAERPTSTHIWGMSSALVFTISGDITTDDMLEVLQSM